MILVVPVSFMSGYLVRNIVLTEISLPQLAESDQLEVSKIADNPQWQEALAKAKESAILAQTAITKEDWSKVTEIWQEAIAIIETLPPDEEVNAKLVEYQANFNYALNNSLNPPNFRNAVNFAVKAGENAQAADSFVEWEAVVKDWEMAIALLESISSFDPNYAIAQEKIPEYQGYLNYALRQRDTKKPAITETSSQWETAIESALAAATAAQTAIFPDEWQQVANQWQNAIERLKEVPPTDPNYELVEAKINTYQRNADYAVENVKNPPYFRSGVNAAMRAATLTQTAKSKQQWQQVAQDWERAIAAFQAIPEENSNYSLAVNRINEYQKNLAYAQLWIEKIPSFMTLVKTITGNISPKSIVHSGNGLFFAQNMMYRHSVTVYDRNYNLIKTLSDRVDLSKYGHSGYTGTHNGSPVEAAFSHNGQFAWVSNYQMYGKGFGNPGSDRCHPSNQHDESFVYRINTETLAIENVIQVGAVPKFLAVSPNNRFVIVSNWCSWDASIIDTQTNQEIHRIKLGAYPRGIVVDSDSKNAYIAIMGDTKIAQINLKDFSVSWLKNIGSSPRHLVLDSQNQSLYSSLNGEGKVAKIDLATGRVIQKITTGSAPRSMTISNDGNFIYVVNYNSDTVSKIRTKDMRVIQQVSVNANPIGITYDPETRQVWVACYSGSILVFQD
ncbi:MAG: hypothetical protein ACOC3E_02545 [Cyanobacteriota bacterium]